MSFFKFFLGFLIKKGKFFKAFFFFKFIILSLKNYNLKPFFFSQYVLYQIKPLLGLRDYYVGRTKYRVPFFIYNFTSIKIGVRWLIKSVNERSENLFKNKFLLEILELLEQKKKNKKVNSRLKKRLHYKTIVNNRPFLKNCKKKKRKKMKDLKIKKLIFGYFNRKGRNNKGVIVSFHLGGGNKRRYRFLDFYRNFFGKISIIRGFFFDYRKRYYISLICFRNGLISYIPATNKQRINDVLFIDFFLNKDFFFKSGNRSLLEYLPTGTFVNNVQINLNSFSKIARSAGSCAQIIRFLGNNLVLLKLRSKKFVILSSRVFGTIGVMSGSFFKFLKILKAGKSRNLGKRPIVRGVAMNPVDHPHGGGEGKTSGGRVSVSPWGVISKSFYKKRRKKKNYKSNLEV